MPTILSAVPDSLQVNWNTSKIFQDNQLSEITSAFIVNNAVYERI